MKVQTTSLSGLLILEPSVYADDRGYFFESYNKQLFRELGIDVEFLQDNESQSARGVLRGLHFQKPPYGQGKLVRVVQGAVLDVAVDIRPDSPTYGQYERVELSAANKRMFYVPEGFAHGFVSLEDETIFVYKCTNVYHKESEGSIRYDDPDLGIDWGMTDPLLSSKDAQAPLFSDLEPISWN